jgi:hypothetical protein
MRRFAWGNEKSIATARQIVGLGHDTEEGAPGPSPVALCQPGASSHEEPPLVVKKASPDLVPANSPVRMHCAPVVQWMELMVMLERT